MLLRRLAVLSSLACLFAVVATGTTWWLLRGSEQEATSLVVAPAAVDRPDARTVDRSTAGQAGEVLAQWDDLRASAWASGDLVALRSLYVVGSRTGRQDVRMLRQWRQRGVRVEGMSTQVHALEVVGSSPRRLRLRVTDRLVGAVAVGRVTRTSLPSDGWSERTIDLRRSGGRWRVLEVRPSAGP